MCDELILLIKETGANQYKRSGVTSVMGVTLFTLANDEQSAVVWPDILLSYPKAIHENSYL